uniref:Uncharacterized protein n=1 Tax=Anopheles coluzzii TaxID=1518534 RepID=A0A6E8VZZ4_ANOCL|nr:uncharacterized protein LOC120960014 [Anopheles coluzzii]
MAGAGSRAGEGGQYFLVCLIGAILIGATRGSPLPEREDVEGSMDTDRVNSLAATTSTEGSTSTTTTTEYPYAAIAKLYAKPRDKVGTLAYSSGVHKFRIGPGEDEQKRLLEEYHYHFERVEKNLPPTTERYNFAPPNKY